MRVIGTYRVSSLFVAIMMLTAMAMPAMACEPSVPCGSKSNAGSPIQLTGEERDKTLDIALKNNHVNQLQKQLITDGFMQKESEAFTVPVELENGSTTEVLVVATSYENDNSEIKTLVYFYYPQTGESITGVVRGSLTACVISVGTCLGFIAGCAGVCAALLVPEPAEPAEAIACLACLGKWKSVTSCATAYCTCTDYYCDRGNQWACDHKCI